VHAPEWKTPHRSSETANNMGRQPTGNLQFVALDITAHYNNKGATTDQRLASGELNVWRNSLSAGELPGGRASFSGVPFELPAWTAGGPDNVRCAGQYVTVPPGRYDWLYLLAAAERRAEDEMALHFRDGTVDFETVRVSDFWAATAAFGEPDAMTSPAMHYPHHVQSGVPGRIWLERVPVVRPIDLTGFRLPRNVAIHIFAVTLCLTTFDSREGHD